MNQLLRSSGILTLTAIFGVVGSACVSKGDTNINARDQGTGGSETTGAAGGSDMTSGGPGGDGPTSGGSLGKGGSAGKSSSGTGGAHSGTGGSASGGTSANGAAAGSEGNEDPPCAGVDIPVSVAAGFNSTCGITSDGTTKCWGDNSHGQLGTGDGKPSNFPQTLPGFCARQVAIGALHACAVTLDESVYCWGANDSGQIGDGTHGGDVFQPSKLKELPAKVLQLAPGWSHTCALLEGGSIYCWGLNTSGQLGTTKSGDSQNEPVLVQALGGDAVWVTAGSAHTCAVLSDGSAQCWGGGSKGQLGNGGESYAMLPSNVVDLANATEISSRGDHTCARLMGGSVACWGTNSNYQLGRNVTDNVTAPKQVAGVSASFVGAGGTFTCGLRLGDGVTCWGSNQQGQSGIVKPGDSWIPAKMDGTEDMTSLALGENHACAVAKGKILCWGAGENGQLGTGNGNSNHLPTKALFFP
jgi:alpha-tubulin suppressor-like RCC1 family protein